MEQIQAQRIRQAGMNLRALAILLIIANLIPVIGYIHISSVKSSENPLTMLFGYGIAMAVMLLIILSQLFDAASNLINCTVEITSHETNLTVLRNTIDGKTLQIISKGTQSIGASVNINEAPAADGEYFYVKEGKTISISVKNGRIESLKESPIN